MKKMFMFFIVLLFSSNAYSFNPSDEIVRERFVFDRNVKYTNFSDAERSRYGMPKENHFYKGLFGVDLSLPFKDGYWLVLHFFYINPFDVDEPWLAEMPVKLSDRPDIYGKEFIKILGDACTKFYEESDKINKRYNSVKDYKDHAFKEAGKITLALLDFLSDFIDKKQREKLEESIRKAIEAKN
ncbi:hypothetical protein KAT92_01060 [Candidatus Babeliales bacterium]|nr:hypothetical protein [Candidatus Babeliales bacterium]